MSLELLMPAEVMPAEVMPAEVVAMLNGQVPATDAVRCACGRWMPWNQFGCPCDVCLGEIRDAETEAAMREAAEEEERDEYFSVPAHRRDPSHPVYGYVAW